MKSKILNIFIIVLSLFISGAYFAPGHASADNCDFSIGTHITPVFSRVMAGEPFDVSWGVDFNGNDYGGVQYSVSISGPNAPDGFTWTSPAGGSTSGMPPTSGVFYFPDGVQNDTDWSITASMSGPDICSGGVSNSDSEGITVQHTPVLPDPGPGESCAINSFTADSSTVSYDTGTTLRFSLSGAVPWKIDLLNGNLPPSPSSGTGDGGQIATGNLTQSQTYRLTCNPNSPNPGTRDLTVSTLPPNPPPPGNPGPSAPTVSLTASPALVVLPQDYTTLNWTTGNNPSSCVASGEWTGDKSTSGGSEKTPGRLSVGSHAFTITCSNSAGTVSKTVTVNVDYDANGCSDNAAVSELSGLPSGDLDPGTNYNFSVRAANTGSSWWYHGAVYQLVQQTDQSIDPTYGHLVDRPDTGDHEDWAFSLKTPTVAGTYTMAFQMVHRAWVDAGYKHSSDQNADCAPAPSQDTYFGNILYINFTVGGGTHGEQAYGFLDSNTNSTNNNGSCDALSGWAWDPDFPNEPIQVGIYDNGQPYSPPTLTAGDHRDDLDSLGNGNHAFTYTIPNAWKDGTDHIIRLYAMDMNNNGNPELYHSPVVINCAPPVTTAGICGAADKTYPPQATSYGSDAYCASGSPSASPAFPGSGNSASWTCMSPNGGTNSPMCTALHSAPGTDPNPPTITGPTAGNINTDNQYTLQASDPDGDQIRYGIDWDMDGVADQWLPVGMSYVDSGTSLNTTRRWNSVGQKDFQALTQDNRGDNSSWTHYSVMMYDGDPVNGMCGTANKTYPSGSTSYGTDQYCSTGNSSDSPGFPGQGSSSTWQCFGINGGSNSPWCVAANPSGPGGVGICSNGATNPPDCTLNGSGACLNGDTNPPQCNNGAGGTCSNGAVNSPQCTVNAGGTCVNGAVNPPQCDNGAGTGPGPFTLTVTKSSGGSVTSSDSSIDCGATCSASYAKGATVNLQATPSSSYWEFTGWAGACSGTSPSCSVLIGGNTTVSANFKLRLFDYFEF